MLQNNYSGNNQISGKLNYFCSMTHCSNAKRHVATQILAELHDSLLHSKNVIQTGHSFVKLFKTGHVKKVIVKIKSSDLNISDILKVSMI
jgi:hypothetical protein